MATPSLQVARVSHAIVTITQTAIVTKRQAVVTDVFITQRGSAASDADQVTMATHWHETVQVRLSKIHVNALVVIVGTSLQLSAFYRSCLD